MSCPSGAPEFTTGFQCGSCYSIFSCMWIVVCPFVLFLLAIVLSVLLRYTDSDYPFGIFKLFLMWFVQHNKLFMPTMFVWFNSITTVWFSREGSVYLSRPHELITPFVFCFCCRQFLASCAVLRSLFDFFSFFLYFPFGHCCFPSLTYSFGLPLLYLQCFIATSHYLSCIFKLFLE